MTKLILSTSNVMGGGPSVIRRPAVEKSNAELTNSLRASFLAAQEQAAAQLADGGTNGSITTTVTVASSSDSISSSPAPPLPLSAWTSRIDDDADPTVYIPSPALAQATLAEDRAAYDITLKLFYLPGAPTARRGPQTREAVDLVLRQLGVSSVDLLIASFPGVSFDADDEDEGDDDDEPPSTSSPTSSATDGAADDLDGMFESWRALEALHSAGRVGGLGLAEFGTARLGPFLARARVRPRVDQINVRDCCVVPKPLILYARAAGIELLTHSDCTNILPADTLRALLAPLGVAGAAVAPQWVVKYTAVVRDQGVVESKGYFAVAELTER